MAFNKSGVGPVCLKIILQSDGTNAVSVSRNFDETVAAIRPSARAEPVSGRTHGAVRPTKLLLSIHHGCDRADYAPKKPVHVNGIVQL
jgi:hypothetical protein